MAKYIDKKGNKIEAELFVEGMERCYSLRISGGYGSEWKEFKTKQSALDFITKNKGAEYLTKMGNHYFDANKIKYNLYIGIDEFVVDDFEQDYIIKYSDSILIKSKNAFEKIYKSML
jgi:hypothetical protein